MRIALLSDSHGNADGLHAVLNAIDAHGTFDHIVFAGDLAWGGIGAQDCIETIRSREDIDAIYGNADYYLWSPFDPLPDDASAQERERRAVMETWRTWTQNKIGDAGVRFLANLPFSLRYHPTDDPADDLLVFHATPQNVFDVIFPSYEKQKTLYGDIQQTDEVVSDLLKDVDCHTVALAHTHVPDRRVVGDRQLINISSISRAGDGDFRAKYAILTFNGDGWQAEHHAVEYDIDGTVQAVLASSMPAKEWEARSLQHQV